MYSPESIHIARLPGCLPSGPWSPPIPSGWTIRNTGITRRAKIIRTRQQSARIVGRSYGRFRDPDAPLSDNSLLFTGWAEGAAFLARWRTLTFASGKPFPPGCHQESHRETKPVDKKDLICEEGEDLLCGLRYDPPFRSRSHRWITADTNRQNRFACRCPCKNWHVSKIMNLKRILILFFC